MNEFICMFVNTIVLSASILKTVDEDVATMPARFVWGVHPTDSGNFNDPSSLGELEFDMTFNISSTESQLWLHDFCTRFRRQPFYQYSGHGQVVLNCFIENFHNAMHRPCITAMTGQDRTPCCRVSTFPYAPHVFDQCLPIVLTTYYESPPVIFLPTNGGPKFDRDIYSNRTPAVRAMVIEYYTTQEISLSYVDIAEFQLTIQTWFDNETKSAPVGLRNGWFVSDLAFYDLQDTLTYDTLMAIFTAMLFSLFVLAFFTLNVVISVYSILTIMFTIMTTIGILVLMGWKLNVLESIAVSTAIGLTIDFSLHYGNDYRQCADKERVASVRYALTRMIGPTFMAALTTGAAGAFMLPSRVLAYIQIGKFLVIVMTVSWLYATFFLMSMLRLLGPQSDFGQYSFRGAWQWIRGSSDPPRLVDQQR